MLKAFITEAGSASVTALLASTEDRLKAASVLLVIEVQSAIRRRQYLRDITPHQADIAIFAAERELSRFILAPLAPPVLQLAKELIERRRLRTLDAIQLATAIDAKRRLGTADELTFAVSDKKLLLAAIAEGLDTWDPASVP